MPDIVFDESEVDVNNDVKKKIATYIDLLQEKYNFSVDILDGALQGFTTTVTIGAIDKDGGSISDSFVLSSLHMISNFVVGKIGIAAPAVPILISFLRAPLTRLDKEDKNNHTINLDDWVHNKIKVITVLKISFSKNLKKEMTEEIILSFLESGDQELMLDNLNEAIENVENMGLPTIESFEVEMYEQWINASFAGFIVNSFGFVDHSIVVEEGSLSIVSCTLQVVKGDKIAKRLNTILNGKQVPGFKRIRDLKVAQRISFCTDDFAGDSWSFGWVDDKGNIIKEPFKPKAKKSFKSSPWTSTKVFFEPSTSFFDTGPTPCGDVGRHKHSN